MDARTRRAARRLSSWDRRMERDSRAALLFALFRDRFANATFGDEFRAAGLDASYFPRAYVLQGLPADSRWFDDRRTDATETRADVVARTLRDALDAAERNGWTTYGDYNRPRIAHPFDVALLNYPAVTTDGGRHTVFNVDVADATGSSWRMVAVPGGPGSGVLPGGQSGNPFSPHHDDQLDMWADGEYKPLALSTGAGVAIRFVEADAEGAS
jgi:penicillin amidase